MTTISVAPATGVRCAGPVELQRLDPSATDYPTAEMLVRLHNDVRQHDARHQPPLTVPSLLRALRHGWEENPPKWLWLAHRGGELAGYAELWLPEYDNRHLAAFDAATAPQHRGCGVGTVLLDVLLSAAKQEGRTLALGEAWVGSAGEAFLADRKFEPGSTEEQRRLELADLDPRRIDEMYDFAVSAATGYELVSLVGAAPESMLESLVDLFAAINDAPMEDLQVEDEVFTGARLRAFDSAQTAFGRRTYRLLARHTGTGAWAGHSILSVDGDQPEWGWQGDTGVLTAHRGHRLGILLKTAMLRWLRDVEPRLQRIDTWNNATNRHMIAVNDALGCVVVGRRAQRQRQLRGRVVSREGRAHERE